MHHSYIIYRIPYDLILLLIVLFLFYSNVLQLNDSMQTFNCLLCLGAWTQKFVFFFLSLCMKMTLKKIQLLEKEKAKRINKLNLTLTNSFTEFKPHGACTLNDSLYYYNRIVYLYVYYRFVTPTSAPDKVGQGR